MARYVILMHRITDKLIGKHHRMMSVLILLLASAAGSAAKAEPAVRVTKSISVIWDPINGEKDPKIIPGSIIRSVIRIENRSDAPLADSILEIVDNITAPLQLKLGSLDGTGGAPIIMADGSRSSNLRFDYTGLQSSNDDVDFSNDGGVTWTYVPSFDADGADGGVTSVRVHPRGGMAANSSFTIELRYRLP